MTPPGPILLFGSGETSSFGRKVFERLLHQLPPKPQVALLETPAGFELNSPQVVGRVAEFIRLRLQNFHPQTVIVPARARGTPESPDNPEILASLLTAELIFMGPGSPTYAVRQLAGSLAWQYLRARHSLGAALVFASAASVAVSAQALPVYEIYKVGEDLHWKAGLDLFGLYGLPLVFIPHWNNSDGGEQLDTSRCFMGRARFVRLMSLLPPDLTVIGLDEKTALMMDFAAGTGRVFGHGGVTLIHTGPAHDIPDLGESGLSEVADLRSGHVHIFHDGESFPLQRIGRFTIDQTGQGLEPGVWSLAQQAQRQKEAAAEESPGLFPSSEVTLLVEQRAAARARKDWAASDDLRAQIAALGWQVEDTKDGQRLHR